MARPRADRVYLKEKEARWRAGMGKPRRGTLVRPGKPPERPLEDLHVRITPETVYLPRWPVKPDGSLAEEPDMIEVKTLPKAIRHEVHKLRGETNSNRRMLRIRRSLQMVHARVVDGWRRMSPEEKEETWTHISQLRDALRGKRAISDLDARDRKKAVERLDRLLERKRPGEMAATLVGVANDITARRNVLLPQMAFTRRMTKALVERKTELDETAFRMLDELTEHKNSVQRGVPKRGPAKRELLKDLRILKSRLDDRPEPELRSNAARHLGDAIGALSGNKLPEAIASMRKSARAILASNALYTWLYPSRLEQVAGSTSNRFKEMVAQRQLRVFRDHLDYWHSPDSHEPLEPRDIRHLLLQVGELVPGSELHDAALEAEGLLRKRKVKAAVKVLEGVVGENP